MTVKHDDVSNGHCYSSFSIGVQTRKHTYILLSFSYLFKIANHPSCPNIHRDTFLTLRIHDLSFLFFFQCCSFDCNVSTLFIILLPTQIIRLCFLSNCFTVLYCFVCRLQEGLKDQMETLAPRCDDMI